MLQPSPNLKKGCKTAFEMNLRGELLRRDCHIYPLSCVQGPEVVFPGIMVRVNAAEPDRRYQYGSSVFLSPSVSFVYPVEMPYI